MWHNITRANPSAMCKVVAMSGFVGSCLVGSRSVFCLLGTFSAAFFHVVSNCQSIRRALSKRAVCPSTEIEKMCKFF